MRYVFSTFQLLFSFPFKQPTTNNPLSTSHIHKKTKNIETSPKSLR